MMKTLKLYSLIVLTAISLAVPTGLAQRRGTRPAATKNAALLAARRVDAITAAQMRNYLTFIASDEMEGRDTPSRGLDTTAKFIAMNLTRWGFKPAGDDGTFFQKLALKRDALDVSNTTAEINGQRFTLGDDFISNGVAGTITGPLVYVGRGWIIRSKNIDDYKGIDVKGKTMVVLGLGFPQGVTQADVRGAAPGTVVSPASYAQEHGAKAILTIFNPATGQSWDQLRQRAILNARTVVEKFQAPPSNLTSQLLGLPSVTITTRMAAALLEGEKFDLPAVTSRAQTPDPVPPFDLSSGKTLSVTVTVNSAHPTTQNVVALWEGSDPVLKNEYVAIGAHYDHIGICAPGQPDPICNGADDDGSGTTAVLSIAEAISHAKQRPKRSVLFVWHCGEEKGLWGSRYFTDYPTIPLNKVVTQLNIDMIGRSKKDGDTNPRNKDLTGPNAIYVIGSTMMSTELGNLAQQVNKSYLNLTYDTKYDDPADPNRFFFRSDHYNYARKGIPIIFFFDGVHEDYHRPGDEAQKIDYDKMEKVTRTIYMTLWAVANLAKRPTVDKPLPAQLTR